MSSPVFQSQYEDINHEDTSREDTPREETPREETPREETSREERTFDGTSREGPAYGAIPPCPSPLAVHGRRLRGCCLPLSRRGLEWQLGTSDVSTEVQRRCTAVMQARPADYLCDDSVD